MSFETYNSTEEVSDEHEGERDHETLRIRNEIQSALIQHACPPDENWGECIDTWAKAIAPKFAEVIENNPELIVEWGTNQVKVLDEIHSLLPEMPSRDSKIQGLERAA